MNSEPEVCRKDTTLIRKRLTCVLYSEHNSERAEQMFLIILHFEQTTQSFESKKLVETSSFFDDFVKF